MKMCPNRETIEELDKTPPRLVEALHALNNRTHREIMALLIDSGNKLVKDILRELVMKKGNIKKAIRILGNAGLVEETGKEGKKRKYGATTFGLNFFRSLFLTLNPIDCKKSLKKKDEMKKKERVQSERFVPFRTRRWNIDQDMIDRYLGRAPRSYLDFY